MAFSKKFNMRDVYGMKLYDLTTKKLFAESKTLKMAEASISNDLTYAAGGVGNTRFASFDANKNAEFSIELAVFDADILAAQLGEQKTGTTTIQVDKQYTIETDDALTLDSTPLTPLTINVFEIDSLGAISNTFTVIDTAPLTSGEVQIVGDKLTFFTDDALIGTLIKVDYDSSVADAYKVTSFGDKFAKNYRVILDVAVKDALTGIEYLGQIDIPNGKLDSSIDLSFSNDGDPMVHNASISVMTNLNTKLQYTLTVYTSDKLV